MKRNILLLMLIFSILRTDAQEIFVGDFGYDINNTNMVASLTYCAACEPYSDITVPETIVYDNNTYTVTSIGKINPIYSEGHALSPFSDCKLFTVTLPKTINYIDPVALQVPTLGAIKCLSETPPAAVGEIVGIYDIVRLYVPNGAKSKYMGTEYWGKFKDCREFSKDNTKIENPLKFIEYEDDKTYLFITSDINNSAMLSDHIDYTFGYGGYFSVPENITYEGVNYEVKYIDGSVLNNYGCEPSLKKLVIPGTIEKVYANFLGGNDCLGSIICKGKKPIEIVGKERFDYVDIHEDFLIKDNIDQAVLYVPEGTIESYKSAPGWQCFKYIEELPEGKKATNELRKVEYKGLNYVICDIDKTASLEGIAYDNDKEKIKVPHRIDYDGETYDVRYLCYGFMNPFLEVKLVELPKSLRKINYGSFMDDENIVSVLIPANVERIDFNAFYNCERLSLILSEMKEPIYISNYTFDFRDDQYLFVPEGTKEKYQETSYWNLFSMISEKEGLSVEEITVDDKGNHKAYDILGRRVQKPYKGLFIKNGKKFISEYK